MTQQNIPEQKNTSTHNPDTPNDHTPSVEHTSEDDNTVHDIRSGGPETSFEEPSEVDAVAQRIEALEAELATTKERSLRALAEAENTRRRAQKDVEDARSYGGTKLATDMLNVLDNLDRALHAATDDMRAQAKEFFEGVELTRRELLNAFSKHKIDIVIPEKGDKFDPNLHQAMFEAPVPDTPDGSIIEVMQAGFTISGRLLRPAFVGVSKNA